MKIGDFILFDIEFTSPLIHFFHSHTKINLNIFTKIFYFFLISVPPAAGREALLRVFVTSLSLWFK